MVKGKIRCNAGELKTVFVPVKSYLVEDEEPKEVIKFLFVGDNLREDKVAL